MKKKSAVLFVQVEEQKILNNNYRDPIIHSFPHQHFRVSQVL